MKKLAFALSPVVGILVLLGAVAVSAAGFFDRGLPTDNLNDAAGALRSNVAWSNENTYVSGDDFTIGSTGEVWVVTKIRTWSVAGHPSPASDTNLGDRYSDVTLYTGSGSIALTLTGALAPGSSSNTNSNITHTAVTYAGGANYQGSSGNYLLIWQNDFTLTWIIEGGVKQYFAVDGTPSPAPYWWFNHASNAALSGSAQQGADDRWIVWAKSDLATLNLCDSNGPQSGVCDGGWDKSSDINVQVFAYRVADDTRVCKDDGWNALVRADGTPFKNQGDCIQYVNTGK